MMDYAINEFVAFYFHDERTSEGQLQHCAQQIERHTPYRVCDLWLSPRRKLAVLNLSRRTPEAQPSLVARLKSDWLAALPRTNRLRVRRQMAIVQTGYTTSGDRRFERSIRETGGSLACDDAGGIAAFCVARFGTSGDERLFLWATRPGIRAIASAEGPEAVVVGTRPRLVHALTRDFRAPSLDLGYVRASLTGWSLADHTPYEGTTLLSVDAMLQVAAGKRSYHAHPTAGCEREERKLRRQEAMFRDALREAVEPLRALPGFELRISGGKDSRLIAAALSDQRITPTTVVCHGPEDAPEMAVARAVAQTLGWPLQRAQPIFAYRGSLLETVRYNLSLSDGFFATEPRHLAFPVHSLVNEAVPGLVMGHMALQKGGWAQNRKETRASIVERCRQRLTRWEHAVVPELSEAVREQLEEYVAGLSVAEEADYGYWINYRFRVGRWLTSHYLSHARDQLPIYPCVDEKVTRVLSTAPLWHLVSERLLAETTWKFAPKLRQVPLFGPQFEFITERKNAAKRAAAALRAQKPPASTPSPATSPATSSHKPKAVDTHGVFFPDDARAAEACAHIRTGRLREELRSLTQPAVWAVIEEPTLDRLHASQVMTMRVNEFIWNCYQASVLHTDGIDAW
jgi:hypothetical protein